MVRRTPERTCVGCRGKGPKAELVRVVRSPGGEIRADRSGRTPGRGAYVHPDPSCIRGAVARQALVRSLRARPQDGRADNLVEELGWGVGTTPREGTS